jgi:hypothetical protein
MTTDSILLILGSLLSLALVFVSLKIYVKSAAIKERMRYSNVKEQLERIIEEFVKHFDEIASLRLNYPRSEMNKILPAFEHELQTKLHLEKLTNEIYAHRIHFLTETLNQIHFETRIIQNLKTKNRELFIHESTTLYFTVIKFMLFTYYLKRKEQQFDLKFDEQLFELKNYKFRLKEGEKGIEGITVE